MERFHLDDMMEFRDEFVLKRLSDAPEAQVNLVTLPPGFAFPAHGTDSNVRLLVLSGQITATVNGEDSVLAVHEMISVSFGTTMRIANNSAGHAAFVVIKAPNPSEMRLLPPMT